MTSISTYSSPSGHRGHPPNFSKLDTDGSGGLDKTELKAMFDKRAEKTGTQNDVNIDDAFSQLDIDGDGSISKDELKAGKKNQASTDNSANSLSGLGMSTQAFADMMGMPPPGPPPMSRPHDEDDDESGNNTTSASSASATDSTSSSDKLLSLLKAIDTNGSGDISKAEIKSFADEMNKLFSQVANNAASATRDQALSLTA